MSPGRLGTRFAYPLPKDLAELRRSDPILS